MRTLPDAAHFPEAMFEGKVREAQQAAIDIALELKGAKLKARLTRIEATLARLEDTVDLLQESIERLLVERKGVKRGT